MTEPHIPGGRAEGQVSDLRSAQACVREFHLRAGQPAPTLPTSLSRDRLERRIAWMMEEIEELKDATAIIDQVDALIDLLYFTLGTLVEMGVECSELFAIVHRANMAKLQNQSAILAATDGKVEKPENWVTPEEEMSAQLVRQASDFELVSNPEPSQSFASCLRMILDAAGYNGDFVEGAEVYLDATLTPLFAANDLPLRDFHAGPNELDESDFDQVLAAGLASSYGVMIGFNPSFVYSASDDSLHFALLIGVVGSYATIIDPLVGVGVASVSLDKLLRGVRNSQVGIHFIGVRDDQS